MDPRVHQTIERMEEQLHRRLEIGELAAGVGLSVAQLTRLFRRDTGSTPGAFLQQLRMERARILIERSSLSIAEIMTQVGVGDRSRFAREFRRKHGFTPRAIRMQLRPPARRRETG